MSETQTRSVLSTHKCSRCKNCQVQYFYNSYDVTLQLAAPHATFPACTQAQKASVLSPTFSQVENGLVRCHYLQRRDYSAS